jgi:hypothetical protein
MLLISGKTCFLKLFIYFETESSYIAQGRLELAIFLLYPPKYQGLQLCPTMPGQTAFPIFLLAIYSLTILYRCLINKEVDLKLKIVHWHMSS